jgi:energy-converting hydrogenase Eha subunit B
MTRAFLLFNDISAASALLSSVELYIPTGSEGCVICSLLVFALIAF